VAEGHRIHEHRHHCGEIDAVAILIEIDQARRRRDRVVAARGEHRIGGDDVFVRHRRVVAEAPAADIHGAPAGVVEFDGVRQRGAIGQHFVDLHELERGIHRPGLRHRRGGIVLPLAAEILTDDGDGMRAVREAAERELRRAVGWGRCAEISAGFAGVDGDGRAPRPAVELPL